VVAGVSAAFPNMLLLAIPLVIAAYGDDGAAALAVLITINLPVMMTVSAILNERAMVVDGLLPRVDTLTALRSAALALAQNPVVIGIAAGIAWRFTGLPLAGPAGTVVSQLSGIAGTLALFTVGMTLRHYGISGNLKSALIITGLKLVVMPGIVFLLLATIIPLPSVWARALVIGAACPTGVNAWLLAARFRTGEAVASNAITLSTAAAAVTITVWLHLVAWL
jgi:predicted permease